MEYMKIRQHVALTRSMHLTWGIIKTITCSCAPLVSRGKESVALHNRNTPFFFFNLASLCNTWVTRFNHYLSCI